MANGDTNTQDKPQLDEFGEPIPTQEEMNKQASDREAERLKTDQTIKLVGAMNQTVAPLAMTLPTQAAPVGAPPPPMTGTQSPPSAPVAPPPQPSAGAAYQFGRGIGVLAAPPTPTNQGRMYMGPAMAPGQEQQFMQSAPGTRMNLMPPPAPMPPQAQATMQGRLAAATGGESDPAALSRLQAADAPGARTLSVRSELPYSDASMANQQNAMRYEAMKKFDAGDRSPEVMAAAMGSTRGVPSAEQQARLNETIRHNKVTEAGRPPSDLVTKVQNGKTYQQRNGQWVHVPDVRNTMDTETETIPAAGGRGEIKRTKHVPVESPATKAPAVGDVLGGYRFKGGNPSSKSNWEKV